MIKVNNLNKFYNKNKSNQIHVINNISLSFDETGLVSLLGPSGSGKTTLLNAIGGLDKVDNGSIEYNDDVLNKYKSDEWDFVRNKNVGYIFQNYNLLLTSSVYDNVMFTLKMTDLPHEIAHERVMYALKSVGIEKYYKRKVTQLSGGQQQRVAIARALAKSPNVIIADEPTGNLDEKNTTMIMNILKKISEKCLVLLVTHEERIAKFYADRIIRLKDGQIVSDEVNASSSNYEFSDDNNIYLQELNKEEMNNDNLNVNYFFDKEKVDIKFNVIYKNNTIYIEPLNTNISVKMLDDSDEIKIIDSKKPELKLEEVEEIKYDLEKIDNSYFKKKANIKFKDTIKMAFKRILEMKRFQKLVFLGFLTSAFLFVIASGSLYSAVIIDESKFIRSSKDDYYISLVDNHSSDAKANAYDFVSENNLGILYSPSTYFIDYDGFSQGSNGNLSIDSYSNSRMLKNNLTSKDIVKGEFGGLYDVLIDKLTIAKFIEESKFFNIGIDSEEDFIGMSLDNGKYTITGIVDQGTPGLYFHTEALIDVYPNAYPVGYVAPDLGVAQDLGIEITSGNVVVKKDTFNIGDTIKINEREYVVSGFNDDRDYILDQKDYIREYYDVNLNSFTYSYTLISFDNEKTDYKLEENSSLFSETYNIFESDKEFYIESIFVTTVILLGMCGVLVTTSLVFLYFIMRGSLISRIYDIGVYRSLGITKKDIRKIFSSEIFVISLFSSFIGYLAAVGLIEVAGPLLGMSLPIYINLLVLALVFFLNITIGLIPVRKLLKLTPSEIGSKYDI